MILKRNASLTHPNVMRYGEGDVGDKPAWVKVMAQLGLIWHQANMYVLGSLIRKTYTRSHICKSDCKFIRNIATLQTSRDIAQRALPLDMTHTKTRLLGAVPQPDWIVFVLY